MNQNKQSLAKIIGLVFVWQSIALLVFSLIPSESGSRIIWLYSTSRLAMISITSVLFLGSLFFYIRSTVPNSHLIHLPQEKGWKEGLLFSGLFLLMTSNTINNILKMLAKTKEYHILIGYLEFTSIFNLFFSLISIEVIIWILLLNKEHLITFIKKKTNFIRLSFSIWGIILLLLALSAILYQKFPPANTWVWVTNGPHVPLLEWHIAVAWGIALPFILYPKLSQKKLSTKWTAILIWGLAFTLWIAQPVNLGYGAQAPVAPNYEIYPFSDAQLYDQNSQSIIIGKGMANEEFPARPIYVVFLALAHGLVGQSYNHIVIFQSFFWAAFPMVLYLLGEEISGRPLGIAIATLAIFRDIVTNRVAHFVVSATYSKVFLSELPVALLLATFILLAFRWIKSHPNNKTIPFIAGGILGIAILLRTQSIIAIVPTFLVAIIEHKKSLKNRLIQMTVLVLGIALVVSPWLIRNWRLTGGIVLDNPLSQMNALAVRYTPDTNSQIPRLPNENDSEYSNRMLGIALDNLFNDPKRILSNIHGHFSQNIFGGFLVFPLRDYLPNPQSIITPTSNFWESWKVTNAKTILYLSYVLLFSIGVSAAWTKEKWLGLLPLVVNIFYNFWTALFMSSGTRFVFPVDWVFYLYQMLGLLTFTRFIFLGLGTKLVEAAPNPSPRALPRWGYAIIIGILFLAGLSLPLSEVIVPDRYPVKTQSQMWAEFHEKTSANVDENLILVEGRALYPRYFAAGEGIEWTAKPGYAPSPESRIVFEMAGQTTGRVIFPLADVPAYFPHTVDVTLLTEDGTVNSVQYILVSDENETILYERNDE